MTIPVLIWVCMTSAFLTLVVCVQAQRHAVKQAKKQREQRRLACQWEHPSQGTQAFRVIQGGAGKGAA